MNIQPVEDMKNIAEALLERGYAISKLEWNGAEFVIKVPDEKTYYVISPPAKGSPQA